MPDDIMGRGLAEERPGNSSEKFATILTRRRAPREATAARAVAGPLPQTAPAGRVLHRERQGQDELCPRRAAAWGAWWRICWLQFIKSKTSHYGDTGSGRHGHREVDPARRRLAKDIEKDIALAHECWALAKEKIYSEQFDLVVSDEITYPLPSARSRQWDLLRGRPRNVHIAGRDAHPKLVEFADLVTEMTEIKHPFQDGISSQPGIDF